MKIRNLSRQYEKIKIILEAFLKIRISKESEKKIKIHCCRLESNEHKSYLNNLNNCKNIN